MQYITLKQTNDVLLYSINMGKYLWSEPYRKALSTDMITFIKRSIKVLHNIFTEITLMFMHVFQIKHSPH